MKTLKNIIDICHTIEKIINDLNYFYNYSLAKIKVYIALNILFMTLLNLFYEDISKHFTFLCTSLNI